MHSPFFRKTSEVYYLATADYVAVAHRICLTTLLRVLATACTYAHLDKLNVTHYFVHTITLYHDLLDMCLYIRHFQHLFSE